MPNQNQIRADYDRDTIVVYQAYAPNIAISALRAKKFVSPFSFNRMTWIKPSFLWLMERSNWGQKASQEHTLAVRITRSGWENALSQGVLTAYQPGIHRSVADWKKQFDKAIVHIQWDPDRSIRGADLQYDAIQVGLSRHIIQQFVDEWIVDIQDYTPLVKKIYNLVRTGHADKVGKLLPKERLYQLDDELAKPIGIAT
jgi:hypothetical protein